MYFKIFDVTNNRLVDDKYNQNLIPYVSSDGELYFMLNGKMLTEDYISRTYNINFKLCKGVDCDGKILYEGDVFLLEAPYDSSELECLVVKNYCVNKWVFEDFDGFGLSIYRYNNCQKEYLGNIYENNELIHKLSRNNKNEKYKIESIKGAILKSNSDDQQGIKLNFDSSSDKYKKRLFINDLLEINEITDDVKDEVADFLIDMYLDNKEEGRK